MKTKIFLLTIATLFAAISASGQGLQIRNNSRYHIDGERISRDEALARTSHYPDVVRQINKGVAMKRAAIGLGITGPLLGFVGMMGTILSVFNDGGHSTFGWVTIAGLGGAMSWTALGLAVGSGRAQRKAMRLYNEYTGYGYRAPERERTYLSLAPTRGGLGLQLTF